jgi:DNA-binding transcriptional LysR family regulator
MHDAAAMRALGAGRRAVYELGVSDHAAGRLLPQMLAPLKDLSDGRQLAVTVGTSRDLIAAFERGQYDAVIGRLDDVGGDGDTLLRDKLVWTASRALRWQPAEPMPFVSLSAPCGIRDIALSALATSGIQWRETFVGTGVAAIQAAVSAGFGIACLEKRNVPPDCKVLAGSPRLPALPTTRLVIRIRDANPGDTNVARAIGSALKVAARATASKPSV